MKIEIKINLTGSLPVPRAVSCLVNQRIITISDLGWYLLFVMQADFGHKYKTYGVVTKSDSILAQEINCNPTTVFKKRKKLIKVGLLKKLDKNTIVSAYELFTRADKTIVPIINQINKTGDKRELANCFIDITNFLNKQQEFIEKRRDDYIRKL